MPPSLAWLRRLWSAGGSLASSTSVALAAAGLVTVVIATTGIRGIQERSRRDLVGQLNAAVDTSVHALQSWLDEQRNVAGSWASESGVQQEILELLDCPEVRNFDRQRVLTCEPLRKLRKRLEPVCRSHEYVGFVVIDFDGREIAALLDSAIGASLEGAPYQTIRRALLGESVVTVPFRSSVALPDDRGQPRFNQPTMFVAAPVRDHVGAVVAALAFRLRPNTGFHRALAVGRSGETGETYAFDQHGLLLSPSRFKEQLQQVGLIPVQLDGDAMLSLELRDPGINLLRGFRSPVPRAPMPLTRMAASAVAGKNDCDVTGYRDYRGVKVVGAWRWLPAYRFGVTHEIDASEAYASCIFFQRIFLSWFGLFAAALVMSLVLDCRRLQTERTQVQTQDSLAKISTLYQAVLDSATQVSIIATDMSGIITVFNSGAERMLQYQAQEMIGRQTPSVIHLESEVREHGAQLSREFGKEIEGFNVFVQYARRGTYEEREWTYVRKDGSQLTVTLVVTAIRDSSGQMTGFLGIAKDVTESKRAEAAMRHERYLLQMLMENLPDSIYFKDANNRFLRCNRALAGRFGLDNPDDAIGKTDFDFFTREHAEQAQVDEQAMIRTGVPIIGKEERETWPDGHRTWVATSKLPMRDGDGRIVGTFGISRDITEKKLAEERFRLVVEASLNALLMVDRTGKILLINSQTERLFGYPREELLGQLIEALVPEPVRAAHERLRDGFFADPKVRSMGSGLKLHGVRKDGTFVPVEIGLSPLETEDGLFALASVLDITARQELEDSLRAAKETAEAASRAKSEFLANMSHEIRTPMNAVIGMTELMLGMDVPPIQREYLNIVLESGEALLAIINEILDFSKIEAGKVSLETIDFSLWDVVGDSLKSLSLRAHSKGLELACRIDSLVPSVLAGDPVRLRQIIVNLVGNAIKFTERGEVLVDVSIIEEKEGGVLLRFAVSDTGMGISPEKQKLIFDAFTQADGSTTRRFGGTGLGLAISSRLVSLMGGELELSSEVGRGSVFSFAVWLARGTRTAMTAPSARREKVVGATVLIVDDNSTNRRILEEMVRSWHMIPLLAESASEALRLVKLHGTSVALVLTDMHMPDMDGLTLVEHLRAGADFADVPVIVLTSGESGSSVDRWERVHVAARLLKPVKQSELLTAIQDALACTEIASHQTHDRVDNSGHVTPMRILLAEDGLMNQRLAMTQLQRWGHRVTVVSNGREAVKAYQNEDFDLVLMDVQMPELDGLEATACIRTIERKQGRHTPIVAMTARAMKGDREQCLEAGMDGYISKPIRQRDLQRALAQWFSIADSDAGSRLSVDWASAIEAVDYDRGTLSELINVFCQESPSLVDQMEQAVTSREGETARRAAHTLRGTIQLFGVSTLISLSERIERLAATGDWESMRAMVAELKHGLAQVYDLLKAYQNDLADCSAGAENFDPVVRGQDESPMGGRMALPLDPAKPLVRKGSEE